MGPVSLQNWKRSGQSVCQSIKVIVAGDEESGVPIAIRLALAAHKNYTQFLGQMGRKSRAGEFSSQTYGESVRFFIRGAMEALTQMFFDMPRLVRREIARRQVKEKL